MRYVAPKLCTLSCWHILFSPLGSYYRTDLLTVQPLFGERGEFNSRQDKRNDCKASGVGYLHLNLWI